MGRALERVVQRADDEIAELKANLSSAKKARESAVAQLRSAIREGKVLPLLENAPDADDDLDGDETPGEPL